MNKIIQGLVEFKQKFQKSFIEEFPDLANGQKPQALMIVCCDSRIMPTVSTRIGPGDLFVLRNIGNIVPPYNYINQGNTLKHSSVLAALEFAIKYLQIPNIIICGHSECGAMKYLLANEEVPETPFLHNWISEAKSVYTEFSTNPKSQDINPKTAHNEISKLNVIHQLENLYTIPVVREAVDRKKLKVYGWWLDISTYDVYHYLKSQNEFVQINDKTLETILDELYEEKS